MSFWKKLAKYAMIAAPIVAAPFTGGASLALIGAAAGAGAGAMGGGGWKGALTGAALGAIPGAGGVGGAAKGAATEVAKQTVKAGLLEAGKKAALSPSVWSQVASVAKGSAGPAGSAIGAATTAAGQNRLNQQNLSMQGNRDNVNGNAQAEHDLMARSALETKERQLALRDVQRASSAKHQNISEFNTRGPKKYTDEYMSALTALEQRGLARLKADPTHSTDRMAPLRTYEPLDIQNLQKATNTEASLMERIGQYAGPVLSTYGALAQQKPLASVRELPMDEDDDFEYGG